MAAYAAASVGNEVIVLEKNEKCGKKIYITGKGRCNLTNSVPPQEFLDNVVNNSKFLISAIHGFSPEDCINLFENSGLPLKVERGNRVFPASDKASDVTKYLEKLCRCAGVRFVFNTLVVDIGVLNGTVSDIVTRYIGVYSRLQVDKVIVCTGGVTYPSTGSTGDGYKFAKKFGHKIIEPKPALCGIKLNGDFYKELQGLTLKNVRLSAVCGDKSICSFFGECLFTHFGISGPIVLSVSSLVNRLDFKTVTLSLDLKPALTFEQLEARLLRDFASSPNKTLKQLIKLLVPSAMVEEVLKRCNLDGAKHVNSVSKAERESVVNLLKNFEMSPQSLCSFDEAIVTSGGIDVREINPKTMESKLISGLYFCGEVLDVDAYTGGFNLQIAFSTGYAAGRSITPGN